MGGCVVEVSPSLASSRQVRLSSRKVVYTNFYSELRHWPDTDSGAIYCSLGLLAASLLNLARLAAGKPTLQ